MASQPKWKTLGDQPIEDIVDFAKKASDAGQVVHIGTDSLQTGRYTQFVTVVVVLTPQKGGRVAYSREIVSRIDSLRERLMKEVWKSTELGMAIQPHVGDIHIHVDANPQEQFMSSKYVQELVGLVVGQGFAAIVKPDAWAASHAADHIVRTKGKSVPRANSRQKLRLVS